MQFIKIPRDQVSKEVATSPCAHAVDVEIVQFGPLERKEGDPDDEHQSGVSARDPYGLDPKELVALLERAAKVAKMSLLQEPLAQEDDRSLLQTVVKMRPGYLFAATDEGDLVDPESVDIAEDGCSEKAKDFKMVFRQQARRP